MRELRTFFVGPMRVLYSYYYKNYIRMGFSSRGAKDAAPLVTLTAYLWVAGWFTGFARCSFNLVVGREAVDPIFLEAWYFFLVIVWALASYIYCKKNHSDITNEFQDVPVPDVLEFIMLVLFFCLPSLLLSVALAKSQPVFSICLPIMIYCLFYFFYFRGILKRAKI